jgi:soluble lytic murein transglycosylase-like protein
MSPADPLAPVLARISSIQSRFGMPSPARRTEAQALDFASLLDGARAATAPPASAPPLLDLHRSLPMTASPVVALPTATSVAAASTVTAGGATLPGTPYDADFTAAARRTGVPARLLAAVAFVESSYRPDVVSGAGAMGMMQLMPEVAAEFGVDPFDPAQAVDGAARLLAAHHERFGSWELALAAYNAGGGAVSRAGNAVPSPAVGEYVRRVASQMPGGTLPDWSSSEGNQDV